MQTRSRLSFLILLGFLTLNYSHAVPVSSINSLPFDEADLKKLKEKYKDNDEHVKNFLIVLGQLKVFPDHENPSEVSKIHDRNITKRFWATPLLGPSDKKEVIGSIAVSDHALKILDEIDSLVRSLSMDLKQIAEFADIRMEKMKKIIALNQAKTPGIDTTRAKDIDNEISKLTTDINLINQQILENKDKQLSYLAEQNREFIKQVAMALTYELSRLGIIPSTEESENMLSDNPSKIFLGFSSLRARAANGQLAVHQVLLEAGLSYMQHDVFKTYLTLRPDVIIEGIKTNELFVKPSLQIVNSKGLFGYSPLMIKAINGSSDNGTCGSSSTCNVVIEYTEMGARWAYATTTGIVLMPVYFEAEVEYKEPDFEGKITCDIEIGNTAKGRLDVINGFFIYDNDIYDSVKYKNFEQGGCKYDIKGGSHTSTHYHALNSIYKNYVDIKTQRAQKSREIDGGSVNKSV